MLDFKRFAPAGAMELLAQLDDPEEDISDRGDGNGLPRFVKQEFREFLPCARALAASPPQRRIAQGPAGDRDAAPAEVAVIVPMPD